ncbi:hypothetical protein F4814DRAFT_455764 [Daldinia grandis]|nr:hypothetical protein F4814DRAFT_455764 [Daldinia grandis]
MIRQKEYNVVITACAPFKENDTNPTQDLKLELPSRIEREGHIPIKIIKYPIDFRNVITDMELIPELWSGKKKVYEPGCRQGQKIYIDAMLHLGMNFADFWQIEKRARRDGYDWVGDDGVPLPKHNGGKGKRWEGVPKVLTPVFNVDHIARRLYKDLPNIPTKTSTDAGLLYCEFIYFTSLATLYEAGETPRALFLHHPGMKTAEDDIKDGVQVAISVICSMIDQLEASQGVVLQHNKYIMREVPEPLSLSRALGTFIL